VVYAAWVPADNELETMTGPQLWGLLKDLKEYNRQAGRGRSQEAAHVRSYCKAERRRVHRALRAQSLPIHPPEEPWAGWWLPPGQKEGNPNDSKTIPEST